MKEAKILVLFVTISILFPSLIYSQTKEIGINFGYGKTNFSDQREFVCPLKKQDYNYENYYQLGVGLFYSPKKSFVGIKTGLNYVYKGDNSNNFNYFRIPLGVDLILGKKFTFIAGGGLYLSYLFAFKTDDSNFNNSFQRFQVGGQWNVGVGYQINQKYNISLLSQHNYDLMKMYDGVDGSPSGNSYNVYIYGYDGFFSFCLKYKLSIE